MTQCNLYNSDGMNLEEGLNRLSTSLYFSSRLGTLSSREFLVGLVKFYLILWSNKNRWQAIDLGELRESPSHCIGKLVNVGKGSS